MRRGFTPDTIAIACCCQLCCRVPKHCSARRPPAMQVALQRRLRLALPLCPNRCGPNPGCGDNGRLRRPRPGMPKNGLAGHPQPCSVEADGAALQVAERRKQAAYPRAHARRPAKKCLCWGLRSVADGAQAPVASSARSDCGPRAPPAVRGGAASAQASGGDKHRPWPPLARSDAACVVRHRPDSGPRPGSRCKHRPQQTAIAALKQDREQVARNVRSSEALPRTLHAGVKVREKKKLSWSPPLPICGVMDYLES